MQAPLAYYETMDRAASLHERAVLSRPRSPALTNRAPSPRSVRPSSVAPVEVEIRDEAPAPYDSMTVEVGTKDPDLARIKANATALIQSLRAITFEALTDDEGEEEEELDLDLLLSTARRLMHSVSGNQATFLQWFLRNYLPVLADAHEHERVRVLAEVGEYEKWLILQGAGTDEDFELVRGIIPTAESLGLG